MILKYEKPNVMLFDILGTGHFIFDWGWAIDHEIPEKWKKLLRHIVHDETKEKMPYNEIKEKKKLCREFIRDRKKDLAQQKLPNSPNSHLAICPFPVKCFVKVQGNFRC